MTDSERIEMQKKIKGSVVPLNIPYKTDESVDYDSLERYVDFLAKSGVPTILLTYGSSEYAYLCDDEIYEITKVAAKANAGRSIFVGATKSWSINKSIEYIKFAEKCGAQSVKVQPPFFGGGIDQENLVTYYKRINDATQLPLWAYSVPVIGSHSGISNKTWQRIVEECSNVYAMKTDGDMIYGLYGLIREAKGKAMLVSGGQMKTMIFGWPFGARSYLCPIAPVFPKPALLFTEYMENGMTEAAIEIIHTFEDRFIDMCKDMNWLVFIKTMLYCAGHFLTPQIRCPGTTANASQVDAVRKLYEEMKVIAE